MDIVSFPDLLAKMLTAFGKTFVKRSGTRFGFLLVPRGVFGPIPCAVTKGAPFTKPTRGSRFN